MNEEQLAELEAQLTRQRDELVQEANRQIAFLNGKIDMIQALRRNRQGTTEIAAEAAEGTATTE